MAWWLLTSQKALTSHISTHPTLSASGWTICPGLPKHVSFSGLGGCCKYPQGKLGNCCDLRHPKFRSRYRPNTFQSFFKKLFWWMLWFLLTSFCAHFQDKHGMLSVFFIGTSHLVHLRQAAVHMSYWRKHPSQGWSYQQDKLGIPPKRSTWGPTFCNVEQRACKKRVRVDHSPLSFLENMTQPCLVSGRIAGTCNHSLTLFRWYMLIPF